MDNDIPAFPRVGLSTGRGYDAQNGMTLRDWFAGMALQGTLASPEEVPNFETVAEWCYQYADAMLKARSNPPS